MLLLCQFAWLHFFQDNVQSTSWHCLRNYVIMLTMFCVMRAGRESHCQIIIFCRKILLVPSDGQNTLIKLSQVFTGNRLTTAVCRCLIASKCQNVNCILHLKIRQLLKELCTFKKNEHYFKDVFAKSQAMPSRIFYEVYK